MSRISHRQRYQSAKMLNDIPSSQLGTLRKPTNLSVSVDGRLEECLKENKELKVRVSKIDQIERYVMILVQQNEYLKKTISELQKKNYELGREVDHIRGESSGLEIMRERNVQQDHRRQYRGLANDFEDTFNNIKLQQQIISQRQKFEKISHETAAKYRTEIQELQQQSVKLQNRYEQEQVKQLKKIQSLMEENNQLIRVNKEREQTIDVLRTEDKKFAYQLRRYIQVANKTKQEADQKTQMLGKLQNDSAKTIQVMKAELQTYRAEMENIQRQIIKYEKLNNQLKQDGAIMMAERTVLKQDMVRLQQLKVASAKQIEKLTSQNCLITEKNHFLSTQLEQSEQRHKHLIAALEKDNIGLRAQIASQQEDISTKQLEIHDLLSIISQLEKNEKEINSTAAHLKQANLRMSKKLQDVQTSWQKQTIEMKELKMKCQEKSRYASETEHNYVELKTKLIELELVHERQNQRIKQLQKLLDHQTNERKSLQQEKQQLIIKEVERQELLRQSQKCIDQCEKLYIIEKQSHASSKQRVKKLEDSIELVKQQKGNFVNEGLQKMERILTEKYQTILKEKQDHFKTKIKYLESELALLQQPQSYHSQQ